MKIAMFVLVLISGSAFASNTIHYSKDLVDRCSSGTNAYEQFVSMNAETIIRETNDGIFEMKQNDELACVKFNNLKVEKYRCCFER